MAGRPFEAHQIKQPIQLLATWFAALVALVVAFLGAAAVLTSPPWLPVVLVIAAIAFVLVFSRYIFLLQTRFRPQIQDDKYYSEHLARELERGSQELRKSLTAADLDFDGLIRGRSVKDAGEQDKQAIRSLIDKYQDPLRELETVGSMLQEADPDVLMEYGKALLANQEWKRATTYLDAYVVRKPADWNGHFLRGVAHANREEGCESDIAALTAYSNTVLLAPQDIDRNKLARFLSYRAAMFKRLHRLDEAKDDLQMAQSLASHYYEAHDIKYNLACVYAMQGDRNNLLSMVGQLNSAPPELARIRRHLNDYFSEFKDDAEFLAAVKQETPQR